MTLRGGVDFDKQKNQLNKAPVDIMVATPGRLIDFVEQKEVWLDQIEFLVIDEADRTVFRAGLVLSAAGSLLLLVLLAVYGAQVATYQPAKAAATAAYWVSGEPPDLPLFVLPHATAQPTTVPLGVNCFPTMRWSLYQSVCKSYCVLL